MNRVTFLPALEAWWAQIEPIRIGRPPRVYGTPDRFVVVELDDEPVLRVDLYRCGDECFAFEAGCIWSRFVVIGWGRCLYLVDLRTRVVIALDLGSYFGHLYPANDQMLVASAEQLFCINPNGSLRWQSGEVGIDGVVVDQVEDGAIYGRGEWDPPSGWRLFQLDLQNGQQTV